MLMLFYSILHIVTSVYSFNLIYLCILFPKKYHIICGYAQMLQIKLHFASEVQTNEGKNEEKANPLS